jgi:hypothetical protein
MNKKIISYKIITGNTALESKEIIKDFNIKVNDLLEDGWNLFGKTTINTNNYSEISLISQSFVIYE